MKPSCSTEEAIATLELVFGKPIPVRASSAAVDAVAGEQYNRVTEFLLSMGYDMVDAVRLRQEYYHSNGLNSGSPIDAVERGRY